MDKLGPLNSEKFYVCLPEGLPLSLQQGVQSLLHICRLSQQLFNNKFMYSTLSGEPALFDHIQKGNLEQNALLKSSIPKDTLMLAATCGASTSWSLRMLDQIKINL